MLLRHTYISNATQNTNNMPSKTRMDTLKSSLKIQPQLVIHNKQ